MFFLVGKSAEVSCSESTLKCLVHDRRAADPHAVYFFRVEFAHLLEDKLLIPTARVDLLLG